MAETIATAEQASGVTQTAPTGAEATTTPQTAETTTQSAQAAPATTTQTDDPRITRLEKELADTRREAAERRVKLKEYEDAQKTAEQRATERLAELEAENKVLAEKARSKAIAAAVTEAATAMGIKPALAVKLIDADKLKFDDAGNVTNAADLVKALATENPELAGITSGMGNVGRAGVSTDPKAHEAELRQVLGHQPVGGGPFSVEYARSNPVIYIDPQSQPT